MEPMTVNSESYFKLYSLEISGGSYSSNNLLTWAAGDCFTFEFAEISDYSDGEFSIDYAPVREDISCDNLSVEAECTYITDYQF